MKNFFPNIETAVVAIFIVCVALWGASRCKKKKEEAALRNSTEVALTPFDTIRSPAEPRIVPRSLPTTPTNPTNPTNPTTGIPPSTISNGQQTPQSYSTTTQQPLMQSPSTTPTPKQTAPPMPTIGATTPQMGGHTTTAKSTQQPVNAEPTVGGLYVLINGLNVRTKPDLKAKSLGKLKLNDQVTFMHEVTEIPQPVRLADGTTITKPWFKIKTKRGTIGWVHGSGVDFYKRKPTEGL